MMMILALLSAFVISYVMIPALIRIAEEKQLYDTPDNERKRHLVHIPNLGGVAIFAGALATITLLADQSTAAFLHLLAALLILFFAGIKDDIFPLSPSKKFAAQLIAVIIIVWRADIRLTGFYGFLGIEELPYMLSLLFSGFVVLVIINAFNLLDGINGLAAGIAFWVLAVLGAIFYLWNLTPWLTLMAATAGACVAFLVFNFQNRIFMGDTGSMFIGAICAVGTIVFINEADARQWLPTGYIPVFAFFLLGLPLFDTLRVFAWRLFVLKRSPFRGDRNHLHHLLIDTGHTHIQASFILYGLHLLWLGLAYCAKDYAPGWVLLLLLGVALMATGLGVYIGKAKKNNQLHSPEPYKA
ncbi:glycosyltransferase family 4 protein [Eisenibacter elegans]|uniref:glycosyltransferase family 4 protein n=1 Tax=Eisenibacter elegans TaxID=997 RepID=UPI00040EE92B|nr:MraY family glycosyltransferase [Eisenibacter elegans]